MENSGRCEICNVNIHRASMQKHFRKKKHLENEKHKEMIIPEWLFKEEQAPILKKVYNSRALTPITRENSKMNDKELEK